MRALPCAVAGVATGCAGPQSALDPQGPHAAALATLWWVMAAGATLILLAVTALVLLATLRAPERRPRIAGNALVIGGGIVFPVLVLGALLVYGTGIGERLLAAPATPPLRIEVTGQQWWWQVRYPDLDAGFATANELFVPVGREVELQLDSADVIHSFWVPSLAGKVDLIPGRRNTLRLRADRAGVFRGQCAEFCGLLHAHMRFVVVAGDDAAFAAWLQQRRAPARVGAEHAAALRDFGRLGCAGCHALRGQAGSAAGTGPDLSHYAARVEAVQAPTAQGRERLAVWLQRRHSLELMPRHGEVAVPDADQAAALAALLESLQ